MLKDRRDGGKRLAELLRWYADSPNAIVLALPRGGVPVAYEVATALNLPMDVFIVRKIGAPGHPELAMGAIASGGEYHLNEDILQQLNVSNEEIESVVMQEWEELKRREQLYRAGRPALKLKNKQVILVDDGLATGASMLAAIAAVKDFGPKEIIVAAPVIARASFSQIKPKVDNVVCVLAPQNFQSVGRWYLDFNQTTDQEVQKLLSHVNQPNMAEAGSN